MRAPRAPRSVPRMSESTEPPLRRPSRLVGVYRADGSLWGEVSYVVGRLLGTAHCALCDITHSPIRRKAAWDVMVSRLGVPFELVHLDERDAATAALVTGRDDSPAVLAEVDGVLAQVLGPDELDDLGGDVDRFDDALRDALARLRLALPA